MEGSDGPAQDGHEAKMNTHERELPVADLAASFQAAVVDMLVEKTSEAATAFGVREVLVAGGVAATALRARLGQRTLCSLQVSPAHSLHGQRGDDCRRRVLPLRRTRCKKTSASISSRTHDMCDLCNPARHINVRATISKPPFGG